MNPNSAMPNSPSMIEPQCWRGRDALRLSNAAITCTLLHQGGTLAEVRSLDASPASGNLIWEAPWLGPADPLSDDELATHYGDANSGRFLHHYTGHALCLDGFGPATAEEFARGGGLHGEAIRCTWKYAPSGDDNVRAETTLPGARLQVQRTSTLLPAEPVLRVDESVRNLGDAARNVHWVQHATVGPPAFPPGARVVTSARDGLTWPLDYEGRNALALDRRFAWPHAPGSGGEAVDLSTLFSVSTSGFVAALKQPRERRFAFVAAQHPETGSLLAYVYRSDRFPWLTLWEENRCRHASPWNGAVQARGLEFGTTPFPLGNDVVDSYGAVMGLPTCLRLGPGAETRAPWLVLAKWLPASTGLLTDIVVEQDALTLRCEQGQLSIPAQGIASFLSGEGGSQ